MIKSSLKSSFKLSNLKESNTSKVKPMIKICDKSSNKLSFLKRPSSDNIDNPFGFTPYDAGNLCGSYGFGEWLLEAQNIVSDTSPSKK